MATLLEIVDDFGAKELPHNSKKEALTLFRSLLLENGYREIALESLGEIPELLDPLNIKYPKTKFHGERTFIELDWNGPQFLVSAGKDFVPIDIFTVAKGAEPEWERIIPSIGISLVKSEDEMTSFLNGAFTQRSEKTILKELSEKFTLMAEVFKKQSGNQQLVPTIIFKQASDEALFESEKRAIRESEVTQTLKYYEG